MKHRSLRKPLFQPTALLAVVVVLLILFLSAAWFFVLPTVSLTPDKQAMIADVEQQRSRWMNVKPAQFQYRITRHCVGCDGDVEVEVDGDYVQASNSEGAGTSSPGDRGSRQQTVLIEEVFDLLDGAVRAADNVTVSYHPRYGFPSELSIDWSDDVVDDEDRYTIERFIALR